MNTINIIENYEQLEKSAISTTGNYVRSAFDPITFSKFDYPCRISSVNEVWKFADCMQEQRFQLNTRLGLRSHITTGESNICEEIINSTIFLTRGTQYSNGISGKNSLSRGLIISRALSAVAKSLGNDGIILELGPGCGANTLILALQNHKIIAVENAQGFYIWQLKHFSNVLGDKLFDPIATADKKTFSYTADRILLTHVPWWEWIKTEVELPKISLITANHMLSEMSRPAFLFSLQRVIQSNIRNHNSPPPMIIFEGWGGIFERIKGVMSDLIQLNYVPVHHCPPYLNETSPDLTIAAFAPKGTQYEPTRLLSNNFNFSNSPNGGDGGALKALLELYLKGQFSREQFFTTDSVLSALITKSYETFLTQANVNFTAWVQSLESSRNLSNFTVDEEFQRFYGRIL